jgi:outer membrane lipoprotein carrier protein
MTPRVSGRRRMANLAGRAISQGAWVILAVLMTVQAARASGLDQLHAFLEKTRSAQGAFTQTVVSRDRRSTQTTSGTFSFARPGKFRWAYEKPFAQLIVADGATVWLYEPDLNQVIVRKLDAALGATPAALLAGDNSLERDFTLVASGERDGLDYVDATPRTSESQFTRIRLGFSGDLPRKMELTDAFGNTTDLVFTDLRRNPALAPSTFAFAIPAGADVVRSP